MGFWGNRVGKIAGLERRADEAGEKGLSSSLEASNRYLGVSVANSAANLRRLLELLGGGWSMEGGFNHHLIISDKLVFQGKS